MSTPEEVFDVRDLLALREQIDVLDQQLFAVLAQRFQVTAQVGQLKKQHQLPPQDLSREAQQLQKTADLAAQTGLDAQFALRLQRLILDEVVAQHKLC